MANEISITAKLSVSKGGTTVTNATSTDSIDMTGTNMLTLVQNIGTSYEALTLTDIDTASKYFVMLRNKDATNYVEVSFDAGSTYSLRMDAGELCGPLPIVAGEQIGCRANTAACEVEVICCES